MGIEGFIQSLRASVAPCIFVSGLGLLLLSMTNRLGRAIDRIRIFAAELETANSSDAPLMHRQIKILYLRCRFLQTAIGLVSASILCVSIIMLMLFSTLAFNLKFVLLMKVLFVASLLCLIFSMIFLFMDICLTLSSLKLRIQNL